MRPAIVLLAKAPVAGRVKTRLLTRFSAEQAAELHTAFAGDMLAMLSGFAAVADVELHTDIHTDAWPEARVARRLQAEGNLGDRIRHSIATGLTEGRPSVMIVGSDAPTLPAKHLELLLHSPADVALGPSEDGGFYAISCRRFDPRMFDAVQWSGPATLDNTVRACQARGLGVSLGATWFDIDTPEDLDRLVQSAELPKHTRSWIRRHYVTESPLE